MQLFVASPAASCARRTSGATVAAFSLAGKWFRPSTVQRSAAGSASPAFTVQRRDRSHRHVAGTASAAASENGANRTTNYGVGSMLPYIEPPSSAETARTIVDLVAHGTLCTTCDDSVPLGTYASYVLDEAGQPVLRLRADAAHTANLQRSPLCSLFVQPGEHPTRLLARVTLIGNVEPVSEEVAAKAADLHAALHAGGMGVDAPCSNDLYYRLKVDRVFYVSELAGGSEAEVITGDEYRAAEADPLRTCAAGLVQHMNVNRAEDVLRISCDLLGETFDDMFYAELLWVDRAGAYLRAVSQQGEARTLRLSFMRQVEDERDARSQLTMLAQLAWEHERSWNPVLAVASMAAKDAD